MYVAYSFGYMGSVIVIISKSAFTNKLPWATVYSNGVMYLSVIGVIGTFMALRYFNKKYKNDFVKTKVINQENLDLKEPVLIY